MSIQRLPRCVGIIKKPFQGAFRNIQRAQSIRNYTQSQYNYHQQYNQYQPRTSWTKRIAYFLVGTAIFSGYAYYQWWPKHTFPSSVAKILRKGLWAESDKGDTDYQLALKYYLEALEECNEIGVDHLSDEYTGIQLKVGEMFERLNMIEDAAYIYNEIATLYLSVLTAPTGSAESARIKDRLHRRHLIQKDLRIAIKLVELNRENPQLSKAILITHLIIAQDEISKQMSTSQRLTRITGGEASDPSGTPKDYTASLTADSITFSSDGTTTTIKKTPEVWEPFADEFFNAMDILGAICVTLGDLAMASRVKISMTESMLLADAEPHKILLSQCNLGSLLYLQADEFEAQEIGLRKKFADISGVDYHKFRTEEALSEGDSDAIKNSIDDAISQEDKLLYLNTINSKDKCIQLATKSFESVLEFAKSLPQETIKNNATINQTVALATYGLGVVNLHLGQYDKAERLFRESRVRSKSCGYDELLGDIERELGKLFKEKKKDKHEEPDSTAPISMDIHIKK